MTYFRFSAATILSDTPARRIAFAATLSLLAHAVLLWLPQWHMPRGKLHLPPLTARLEPLPGQEKQDSPARESHNPLTRLGKDETALPSVAAEEAMKKMQKAVSAAPLKFPARLQLAFAVYRNGSATPSGEMVHQMDIRNGKYSLKSVEQDAGVTGQQRVRSSFGKAGERGLQPEIFEDEQMAQHGKRAGKAMFKWREGEAHFSQGGQSPLPDDTQDALSFMYQLSQLSMQREIIPLSLGDAGSIQDSPIEIGGEEEISTPMGKVRALHLRKMHDRDQAYFEIWLGVEYRMLPVRFRRVNESGETVEEYAISDIRASDD